METTALGLFLDKFASGRSVTLLKRDHGKYFLPRIVQIFQGSVFVEHAENL